MLLPADHPQRLELNDEVHARPPEPLSPPARMSYLALLCDAAQRDASVSALTELCRRFDVPPPSQNATHYAAKFPSFRLKWERHTEFIRCMFIVRGMGDDPFADTAITAVPQDWIAALPGRLMVAVHTALIAEDAIVDD